MEKKEISESGIFDFFVVVVVITIDSAEFK
jgi:hypothetical protein